ncbi:MAG: right-handed parallel beta-helix repeat-containing protein [Actinomycetota bacterium]
MIKRAVTAAIAIAIAMTPVASHASGTGFETGSCQHDAPGAGAVLQVGAGKAFSTIQSAVNAANSGDHIVVFPGTYDEAVKVTTNDLRITGTDRAGVILDGQNAFDSHGAARSGFTVTGDRVLIENITAHNYTGNGFFWIGTTGYWGRYLTAYDNGDYGIYAFRSRCGELDHSFSSGNADSGFYIGGCYPCDAVITNVDTTGNGLGYSGTNAGGNLTVRDSLWHDNAMGIVPSSLDSEPGPPNRGLTIENNTILNNNCRLCPGTGLTGQYWGIGITLPGTSNGQVIGNTVTGNDLVGIGIAPLPSTFVYIASSNVIYGNHVHKNGLGDPNVPGSGIGADLAQGAASGPNNCWSNNDADSTAPPVILQTVWGCSNIDPNALPYNSGVTPPGGDPRIELGLIEGQVPDPQNSNGFLNGRVPGDWKTWTALTCSTDSGAACIQLPDQDGDSSYVNDGAPALWIPAVNAS